MSEHTPGPWCWAHNYNGLEAADRNILHYADYEGMWLPIYGADKDRKEAKANARLIAAAPDMYEALIDLRDNDRDDDPEMWGRAFAAIAKATGEQG